MSRFHCAMLPFNSTVYMAQYPTLVVNYSVEELSNIWNNEALVLGSKVISMLRHNIPINASTGAINVWNATTNTPTLSNSVPAVGECYLCTVGGSVDFGAGNIAFNVYDIVSFNSLFMQWFNIGQPVPYYWAGIIMSHILTLYNRPVVGRLNTGTEGDVTGGFDYTSSMNSAWWNQTTYGARVWKLIKQRGGFTAFINVPYGGILYQGANNIYGNSN